MWEVVHHCGLGEVLLMMYLAYARSDHIAHRVVLMHHSEIEDIQHLLE